MCKYSFILPYYNRGEQFKNTLDGLANLYGDRNDYEIIVIEDFKNLCNEQLHNELLNIVAQLSVVHLIARPEECIYNPAPHYNMGAREAEGQYLILSNPECLHKNDILKHFDAMLEYSPKSYLCCACQNFDGAWYQHSQYYNKMYHWCSCISKEQFNIIGGFDECYAAGHSFEDDDFVSTLQHYKINIILLDDCVVLHQQHEETKNSLPNLWDLWGINNKYFTDKWTKIALGEKK